MKNNPTKVLVTGANGYIGHHVTNELLKKEDIKQLETLKYSVNIALTPQKQNKIIIQGKTNYDLKLINAIVQSFWFNEKCANGELSREEKISGNNKRFKNLRFLPPNIIIIRSIVL